MDLCELRTDEDVVITASRLSIRIFVSDLANGIAWEPVNIVMELMSICSGYDCMLDEYIGIGLYIESCKIHFWLTTIYACYSDPDNPHDFDQACHRSLGL